MYTIVILMLYACAPLPRCFAGGACCEFKLEDILAPKGHQHRESLCQPPEHRQIPQLGPV